MNNNCRPALVLASLASLLLLSGCAGASQAESNDDSIAFAMPPGTDDPALLTQVDAVAAMIESATGRTVTTENPADYMAVVEAVRSGFVDVALMSQFSTALAVANGSVSPLIVWEAEDLPAALCLVRSDSGLTNIADIRGKQVAFVDPGSTTGYFMPKSLLTTEGLIDGEDYTSTFAGGHDSAVLAMLNGSVDMACTARQLYPTMINAQVFAPSDVRIIAETDPVPIGISIVVRPDLDEKTRQQLIDSLPAALMKDKKTFALFGGSSEYIVNPSADVYAPLLKVAENVGVSLKDMR